jgi:hypothetical protein
VPIHVCGNATITVEMPAEKVPEKRVGDVHRTYSMGLAWRDADRDEPLEEQPIAELQPESTGPTEPAYVRANADV